MSGPLLPLLEYGASWLHFVALVTGAGAVLGRTVLSSGLSPVRRDALHRAAGRAARAAGMLGVVAFAAIFARQLVEFRDPFAPLSEDARLLLRTDWGAAWRWGSVAAVVALAGFWGTALGTAHGRAHGQTPARAPGPGATSGGSPVRAVGWVVGTLGLVVTAAYPAFTGHAAAGEPRAVSIGLDVLHVLAASVWIGGLGMVVVGLRASGRAAGDGASEPGSESTTGAGTLPADRDASALVHAFSPFAMAAVAALIVSGVAANLRMMDSPAVLLTTPWGRLLSLKLFVVAGVLALGARNWRRLTPRLGTPDGDRDMTRSATLELVLGHVVLVVTAILIRTSPG